MSLIFCNRSEKLDKITDKYGILINLILALLSGILCFISLDKYRFISLIVFAAAAGLLNALKVSQIILKNTPLMHFAASAAAVIFFLDSGLFLDISRITAAIIRLLFCIVAVDYLLSLYLNVLFDKLPDKRRLLRTVMCCAPVIFTVFVYLPTDTYMNNLGEFRFRYQDFIFLLLAKFLILTAAAVFVTSTVKRKVSRYIEALFVGALLCVYVQYMFMNTRLDMLTGGAVDWSKYKKEMIFTAVVWAAVMLLSIVIIPRKNDVIKKILAVLPAFIGGIELVTAVVTIAAAGSEALTYRSLILSPEEQFTVSGKKNIITFIFDNCDSTYFDTILQDHPDDFEGLEDFTLYDNTCSFFAFTNWSINSMYTGWEGSPKPDFRDYYKPAWHTEEADEFYNRFHEAGYKINYFLQLNYDEEDIQGKVDNFIKSDEKPIYLSPEKNADNMMELSLYRAEPYLLKKLSPVGKISREHTQVFGFDANSGITFKNDQVVKNSDFLNKLKLNVSDSDENYFILEHLNGTHEPLEQSSPVEEARVCLKIVREYISQLKALGLYDDSVIIVTADHGEYKMPAPTPIFMIKEAGRSSDKMEISNAPIHHRDLLATYLEAAGLHNGADDDRLFGTSIYDHAEGEERERVTYYRTSRTLENSAHKSAGKFVYCEIHYTGTKEDIKKDVEDENFINEYVIDYIV